MENNTPKWQDLPIQMRHDGLFIIQKIGVPFCINPIDPMYGEVYDWALEHPEQVEHLPDPTPTPEQQLETAKEVKLEQIKQTMTLNDTKLARATSEHLTNETEETKKVLEYLVEVQNYNRGLLQSVALCETLEAVESIEPRVPDIAAHLAETSSAPAKYEVK